jgi:hypothetical protein
MGMREKYDQAIQTAKRLRMEGAAKSAMASCTSTVP